MARVNVATATQPLSAALVTPRLSVSVGNTPSRAPVGEYPR